MFFCKTILKRPTNIIMQTSFKDLLQTELKSLVELKHSERPWHMPLIAAFCASIALFSGLYLGQLSNGLLVCLGGHVILYMPSLPLTNRMITMIVCSFGMVLSFTVGIAFSFNPWISTVVVGAYATLVHWVVGHFKLKAPGSFFFLLIAVMASCMPFGWSEMPQKIGLIAMGTMLACIITFIYSLVLLNTQKMVAHPPVTIAITVRRQRYHNLVQSMIVGCFVMISLGIGHFFALKNPYWVAISCLAIMQGISRRHVLQRIIHRILGTTLGLGLCWLILHFQLQPLTLCLSIVTLMFIIETLIVRNYVLAVIFITPMTIFLTQVANPYFNNTDLLFTFRLLDIVLGSLLGALGGWLLFHNQFKYQTAKQIQRVKLLAQRRHSTRTTI
ncbi:FUSC family protein [Flectobacillus sp. BAB-3569]|nr:FUSC family protein [Flectobacillus sp. BAB-3569]